jgi:hypothetical protein
MSGGLEAFGSAERARRRPHDPARPHLVPAIAAGSRDPVVRDLIPVLEQLYARRHALRSEWRQAGKLLFPAFPEFLGRPGGDADHDSRRSDGFEAAIRVLLTLAACCNWRTMEILDPSGGYLAVHRLAELAELPHHLVAPKDDGDRNRRFRMDTVERALRGLRVGRILCFTKQHREQKADGSHTTTAPALRKLSVHFFTKCGGDLSRTFLWRRGELKKFRGRHERRQRERAPGVGADVRVSEALEEVRRAPPVLRSVATGPAPSSSTPPDLIDAVAAEHPEWSFPDVLREAQRRWQGLDPPTGGAGAPPELD